MKKYLDIKLLLILITILSMPLSCIKQGSFTETNLILEANIKLWMEGQKTTNTSSNTYIDSLKNRASWPGLSILSINSMENLVYVPIQYNTHITGLVFIINNKNQRVETGYLSEISSTVVTQKGNYLKMQSPLTHPEVIMTNFYRYKLNDFTGKIMAYAITNKFLWEMGYSSGTNIYKKKIVNFSSTYQAPIIRFNNKIITSPFDSVAKSITPGCKAYFLVTYWQDMEASISSTYLGETCNNQCEKTMAIAKDTLLHYTTFCSGAGR